MGHDDDRLISDNIALLCVDGYYLKCFYSRDLNLTLDSVYLWDDCDILPIINTSFCQKIIYSLNDLFFSNSKVG